VASELSLLIETSSREKIEQTNAVVVYCMSPETIKHPDIDKVEVGISGEHS
jgi:hypothetical protein